ncbi:hypothetical protein JVT61DRAFT_15536 [Boletus reticuloceps]|uniref:DUF6532 domain-containing protein n=1 Tax=Boletus reticuloceps TaxID=495285 RepID=A0A8I3A231_9AGAM|nr:hypothetical protein JVT61DRAFT_15536 [Boletus reticuloceps]
MEWVGVTDDGDGNGVPRASLDDEKMFNEEDESSDSKDGSEAQMGVDTGYTRGRGESGDESEEQSRQSAQANDDSAPGGSAVCDKFDDFAGAYGDEPPPNWQEDDHTKGTEDNSDNYSSDEDEDDDGDSDGDDDQSKNHDPDGTQHIPQEAPQRFRQHAHAEQRDGSRRKPDVQRSRSVAFQQDVRPQRPAPSSRIAQPLAPPEAPSERTARGVAPSANTKQSQHRISKARHQAATGNRSRPFEDGQANVDHDVLQRHHSRNRRPRSPSPTYLASVSNGEACPPRKKQRSDPTSHKEAKATLPAEDNDPVPGDKELIPADKPRRGAKYSKTAKADVSARPTTLSFFKHAPLWGKLLDAAKGRMRLYLLTENPFPEREISIDGICTEILEEMIREYEDNGLELESGFYNEYRRSMAMLLFNDIHTFRSEIKKAVVRFVPSEYGLYPPERIDGTVEGNQWVKDKAMQLLDHAQFLRGAPDARVRYLFLWSVTDVNDTRGQGKASNFAHPALKKSCLAVCYGNGSKSLYRFPEFQSSMPTEALLVVSTIVRSVLTTYQLHGENKPVPLQVDEVKAAYHQLDKLMDQLMQNKYHSKKLRKMLANWAKMGMAGHSSNTVLAAGNDYAIDLD